MFTQKREEKRPINIRRLFVPDRESSEKSKAQSIDVKAVLPLLELSSLAVAVFRLVFDDCDRSSAIVHTYSYEFGHVTK